MNEPNADQRHDNSLDELAAASDDPLRRVVVKPVLPFRTRVILILMRIWAAVLYLGSFVLVSLALTTYVVSESRPFVFETFDGGFRARGWAIPLVLSILLFVVARLQSRVIRNVRTTVHQRLGIE
jgi:hypothetical protein